MTTEELRRFSPKQILNRYNLDAFSHAEFDADPATKVLRVQVWWTEKKQVRLYVLEDGVARLREWAGEGWAVDVRGVE